MPRGDGTGPPSGDKSRSGRMKGNRAGSGPGGTCSCPQCGETVPHKQGVPCFNISCPKCGTNMLRN